MAEHTADAAPDGAPKPPASQDVPPHRQPSFIGSVEALIKGEAKPFHEASAPVVEDLRATAAEQDELRKQLQKVSETAQQAQGALLQAQGRADALLQVLYRLESLKP